MRAPLPSPRRGRLLPFLPSLPSLAAILLLLLAGLAGPSRADGAAYQPLLDRAIRTLQEAEVLYLAGRRDAARHPAGRALVLLAEAARIRTRTVDPAYLAVHAAVFAGDRSAAATWMQELGRRLGPGSPDPRFHVARGMVLLYLEGTPEPAVEALEQARRVGPRRADRARDLLHYAALMAAGDHHVRARAYEKALERYREAVRLAAGLGAERKRAAARGNAGITLLRMGRAEDAELVFRVLATEDPEAAIWPLFHGRSLHALGRLADAASAWARAAALADAGPASAPYRVDLREARFDAAIAHLQLADQAARAEERDSRRRQARTLLERYVETAPDSHRGQFVLGRLLHETFEAPHAAIRHLEEAHRIDPVCDASIRLLIRIASRVGPPGADALATPEAVAAAEAAWKAKRLAWERELEANTDAWEAERRKRRERSRSGTDGCPRLE